MFRPTIEDLEELMRAKEICESIIDEISESNLFFTDSTRLSLAATAIEKVLESFNATIEALTP